jgi:hypothetical protein
MATPAYNYFANGFPVGTQTPPDYANADYNNIHALRDAVVCGAMTGFDYSINGGSPGRYQTKNWGHTQSGLRLRFQVHAWDAYGRPQSVEWFYSNDAGATYSTMSGGPIAITWNGDGFIQSVSDQAGAWVQWLEAQYRSQFIGPSTTLRGLEAAFTGNALRFVSADQANAPTLCGLIEARYEAAGWDRRRMNFHVGQSNAVDLEHVMALASTVTYNRLTMLKGDHKLIIGAFYQGGVAQYASINSMNGAESAGQPLYMQQYAGANLGIGVDPTTGSLPARLTLWGTADVGVFHIHQRTNSGGSSSIIDVVDDRAFGGNNSGILMRLVARNDRVDNTGYLLRCGLTGGFDSEIFNISLKGEIGFGAIPSAIPGTLAQFHQARDTQARIAVTGSQSWNYGGSIIGDFVPSQGGRLRLGTVENGTYASALNIDHIGRITIARSESGHGSMLEIHKPSGSYGNGHPYLSLVYADQNFFHVFMDSAGGARLTNHYGVNGFLFDSNLMYNKRIAQELKYVLPAGAGAWAWENTPTHVVCAPNPGENFALNNCAVGETKRMWLQNGNIPSFNGGTASFTWVGTPTQAAGLITFVCVDDNYVLGFKVS